MAVIYQTTADIHVTEEAELQEETSKAGALRIGNKNGVAEGTEVRKTVIIQEPKPLPKPIQPTVNKWQSVRELQQIEKEERGYDDESEGRCVKCSCKLTCSDWCRKRCGRRGDVGKY